MAPNDEELHYKDKKYYPDRDEFMQALNSPPEVHYTRGYHKRYSYPKIAKISSMIFEKLKEENFPTLPPPNTSQSQGSREIAKVIMKLRKKFYPYQVHEELAAYAMPDSKVFIIFNDAEYFGFDVFLRYYTQHLCGKVTKSQKRRTPSDGIRVAAAHRNPPLIVRLESGLVSASGDGTDSVSEISGLDDEQRGEDRPRFRSSAKRGGTVSDTRAEFAKRRRLIASIIEQLETELDLRRREREEREAFTADMPGQPILGQILSAVDMKKRLERAARHMTPRTKRNVLGDISKKIRDLARAYREACEPMLDSDDSN